MRDKRAKFVQLANQRVAKAIDQIRLVGNLSNKSAYEFTDEDARKIVKALQKAVDTTKGRFADQDAASARAFSID